MKNKNRYRPIQTKVDFGNIFENYDTEPKVVFVDIETEGLDPDKHGIIMFAAEKYDYKDFKFQNKDVFSIYINPHRPLDPEIVKKTKLTDELLEAEGIDEDEAFFSILEFLEDVDVFVAYNDSFDWSFVKKLYERYGETLSIPKRFDVMKMACDLYSIYDVPGSRTLGTFAKKLGIIESSEGLHDAEYDAHVTFNLFNRMFWDYSKLPIIKQTEEKPIPEIKGYWYWENPKKPLMKRIYFATSCGKMFYEMIDRSFGCDQKEKAYTIDELNMEAFIDNVLKTLRVGSVEALSHLSFTTK